MARKNPKSQAAFTLIELSIVFVLIGMTIGLLIVRTGTFSYWRKESFIRQLSDTLIFLHHQAISDQAFYRIEFDFEKQVYSVGLMRPEYDTSDPSSIDLDAGNLTLELSSILSPSVGSGSTLIPPPSFPSLAKPVELPPEIKITEVRTTRGKQTDKDSEKPFILFSPRGFSEFAVIHLTTAEEEQITILINPFSGNSTIYREYKDFEWTYGKNQSAT